MKKTITILLIAWLLLLGISACTRNVDVPIAGFYTPRETIDIMAFNNISDQCGSDAVEYYEIKLQITNISDNEISISEENFECIADSEVIDFFYNEQWLPNAMTPFTLKPNVTTTKYLYIKVPIDTQYIRFCIFTEYDCAYYTLKTP